MTEKLIAEWNEKVRPCDVVFHLGDFSFGKWALTEAVLNRLNGTIIWVLGNHDKVIRDNITENVFDYLEVMVNGTKVVMSHYPMTAWNQQGRGSVMLHGHCHGHFQGQGRIQDAGYDALGSMVRLDMLVERILEREIYTPDNH
jgi:calcineurin-like phosphoesterase family protein